MGGLSPPARGNRGTATLVVGRNGPIPASAGEPPSVRNRSMRSRAYPRQRGGTVRSGTTAQALWGLSPPARGNLQRERGLQGRTGPIPASAGEPTPAAGGGTGWGAYPRQRGGTTGATGVDIQEWGLSPPARGNRIIRAPSSGGGGPIPASAGEPPPLEALPEAVGAYPRQRGGTDFDAGTLIFGQGLSPPARGNLADRIQAEAIAGPIPASAGEP